MTIKLKYGLTSTRYFNSLFAARQYFSLEVARGHKCDIKEVMENGTDLYAVEVTRKIFTGIIGDENNE